MPSWQLQDAKNKLSELIDRVLSQGPQIITRRGAAVAVVMPFAEYQRLTAPKQRLGDFFLASPLRDSGLMFERDRRTDLRDIEL